MKLLNPISRRELEIYCLTLPSGPDFESYEPIYHWKSKNGKSVAAILFDQETYLFSVLVLRRRTDSRFVKTHYRMGLKTKDEALAEVSEYVKVENPPEPLPSGEPRRASFLKDGKSPIDDHFKLLTETDSHYPALMTISETYLALPRPDPNFATDFQTENFDSRLFELYLLAAFREQGALVSQDVPSPDFYIERKNHHCWVEAVTANSTSKFSQGLTVPTFAPEEHQERLIGAPAVRFAKTLRSKLQREYENKPHVSGKPFALALADFHAPSSMVWSREALPSYLYGTYANVEMKEEKRSAVEVPIKTLLGTNSIPAGLFKDPEMSHLSAVIFSNAATLGKFNRMGFLAGWRPPGLKMIRQGIIWDRTPGALDPIKFEFDVLSDEYAALWPWGEAWCQEMEVFHNPNATHPINFDLLPGACHWFETKGELLCNTIWENSVLSSVTKLSWGK